MQNMQNQNAVIIIGAGPTGLTMAYELNRYGIAVRIIDKNTAPTKTSNALGVHIRTLELWYDMGIIDSALEKGKKIHSANIFSNKTKLAHVEFKNLTTAFPFMLSLPQSETEKIMNEKLKHKGVIVERSTELISLKQTDECVSITLSKNGQVQETSTPWLIACDGSHSLIRDKLKLNFIGEDFSQHFIMSDLAIDMKLDLNEIYTFFALDGAVAVFPLPNDRCRLICDVTNDPKLHATKSPQLKDFINIVNVRCPIKIKLSDPAWISTFWIRNRMLENYRYQRIFFAGDAAHIHSPVGGQGMNTGIQDAYNLAWKLAYVIQNKAKIQLLDSYNIERHIVAKNVLAQTKAATKMVTLKNHFLQWLRNYAVKIVLSKPEYQRRIALQMSELAIAYTTSPLNQNDINKKANGPHAGQRLPYVKGLFEKLQGTQFHLLLFADNIANTNLNEIIKYIQAYYAELIQTHLIEKQDYNGLAHLRFMAKKECLYLIRPDNYIAYRASPAEISKLQGYLQNLFCSASTK